MTQGVPRLVERFPAERVIRWNPLPDSYQVKLARGYRDVDNVTRIAADLASDAAAASSQTLRPSVSDSSGR